MSVQVNCTVMVTLLRMETQGSHTELFWPLTQSSGRAFRFQTLQASGWKGQLCGQHIKCHHTHYMPVSSPGEHVVK